MAMLTVSLALNAIVAVGNWSLYSRVRRLEAIHESQAQAAIAAKIRVPTPTQNAGVIVQ